MQPQLLSQTVNGGRVPNEWRERARAAVRGGERRASRRRRRLVTLASVHDQGLGSWPTRRRRLSPDRVALVHGDDQRTYAELDDRSRRLHLQPRLARYKLPKYVVFTDALPRSGAGKVLKNELRDRFATGAGSGEVPAWNRQRPTSPS